MTTEPASQSRLSDSQTAAIRHVRGSALRQQRAASRRIEAVLTNALPEADADIDAVALAGSVTITAPVVLNFHPDRIASDGRMVGEAMLEDGIYRNQFESGISNGGLTAFPGGDRDRWEERSFGGAYQRPGVSAHERPKYGGLNLMQHPDGPCPRFGSCQLRPPPGGSRADDVLLRRQRYGAARPRNPRRFRFGPGRSDRSRRLDRRRSGATGHVRRILARGPSGRSP